MKQRYTLIGHSQDDVVRLLARTAPFTTRLPIAMSVNSDRVPIENPLQWLAQAFSMPIGRRGRDVSAKWAGLDGGEYSGPYLSLDGTGVVSWNIPEEERWPLAGLLGLVDELPLESFVVGPMYNHRPEDIWGNDRTPKRGIGRAHDSHGLGVMFRGKGYDSLVSRRWLEHGPWLVEHRAHDSTWIQFHDETADAATAWAQAARAHERMGIDDRGGYLQHNYLYSASIRGVYKPADRSFTVVNSGTAITQRALLDLCAYRAESRAGDEPIARLRVLFFDGEVDARRYLHELWLREIECWYIDPSGHELRLDDTYEPERILPEWVERRLGRPPRDAAPKVRLSLGLAALLDDPEGELPGDWCRDDLLFHIIDWLDPELRTPGYELREVLNARLPLVAPKGGQTGDLVVSAGDAVGGVLSADVAAPLLDEARAVTARVELTLQPERLGLTLPAIIVSDPYPKQRPIRLPCEDPINGVTVIQVSDVLARVRSLNREDLRDAEALLQLCARFRFVLSATS